MTNPKTNPEDLSIDSLQKTVIEFHEKNSPRMHFENGPLRQWRCPFCEIWLRYENTVCRCGITRDNGPQAELDDLMRYAHDGHYGPSIKIDRF